MLSVYPVVGERLAGEGLALRDLVFVMWKDIIDAARMQVEMRAQILHRHGAALDMPAGEAASPGTVPRHFAAWLAHLPQRKIFGVAPVRCYAFAHTRQNVLKLVAGELAIIGEAFDVKIDVAIDLVCHAPGLQALNDG